MTSTAPAAALEPILAAELARRDLLAFSERMDPRFATPPKHLQLIARELEGIERGDNRFLMINLPPRHAKTTLSSQLFVAYAMGRNPRREIILASHSVDLSERNSRAARGLMVRDEYPFTNVRLAQDSTAATRWHVEQGGSVRALGVGSDILGRGADLLIIDDAIDDAFSVTECETAFRWYRDQAFSRLNAGGAVIVIGQRLSESDLCGQILTSDLGEAYRVINLPAIAEADDLLGRAEGEALWPEVFGLDELALRRAGMGSRSFETQYQGHPASFTGYVFKRAWFDQRYDRLPSEAPTDEETEDQIRGRFLAQHAGFVDPLLRANPVRLIKATAIDCASKTGLANDYTAIVTIVYDGAFFYVTDVRREKLEFPDLVRRVIEVYKDERPSRIFIEEASAGIAVCQELRRRSRLPVIPIPPKGSKRWRAETASPNFEAGRVLLPRDAPWDIDCFVDEFCDFDPSGTSTRHDDQVDATVLCISMLEKLRGSWRADERALRVATNRYSR